jgi:hypothetical protein
VFRSELPLISRVRTWGFLESLPLGSTRRHAKSNARVFLTLNLAATARVSQIFCARKICIQWIARGLVCKNHPVHADCSVSAAATWLVYKVMRQLVQNFGDLPVNDTALKECLSSGWWKATSISSLLRSGWSRDFYVVVTHECLQLWIAATSLPWRNVSQNEAIAVRYGRK